MKKTNILKSKILSGLLATCVAVGIFTVTAWAEEVAPTVEIDASTRSHNIYGNGFPLLIVDGNVDDTTTVYWDKNDNGTVDDDDKALEGATNADLSYFFIYGGAKSAPVISTKITMTGGIVGYVYGGGIDNNVESSTEINIMGGIVSSHLYGGGGFYSDVGGNTNINITGGTFWGNLHGGGVFGSDVYGNTNINITGGTFGGSLHGGGAFGSDVMSGTNINIKDSSLNSIYGGAFDSGTVYDERKLIVSGNVNIGYTHTIDSGIRINSPSVTDGFDSFEVGDEGLSDSASVVSSIPQDFEGGVVATNVASEYINDQNTGKIILNGSTDFTYEIKDKNLHVEVKLKSFAPTVIENSKEIYGNGSPLFITAGTVEGTTSVYGDKDNDGNIEYDSALIENADLSEYSIYGGSTTASAVVSKTKITMDGGYVGTIVGGGNVDNIADSNPSINVLGDTNVAITGGTVGYVYGACLVGAISGDTNVTIINATVKYAYGGAYKGIISGGTNVTVENSSIDTLYGGSYDGDIFGTANTYISGGLVNEVYGYSENNNESTAFITVNEDAVISTIKNYGNLYLSGDIKIGDTTTESGIFSTEAHDIYVNNLGDEAQICVILPDVANEGFDVAWGAKSSDISKITLFNNPQNYILNLKGETIFLGTYTEPNTGSSGTGSTSPEVKDPETNDGETNVDIEVKPTTSGGNSTADIPDDTLEEAINDALDEVKDTDNAPKVTINVDTPKSADSVEVTLDSSVLEDLSDNENAVFEIKSDVGTASFDKIALANILAKANGKDITIVIREATNLTDEQKDAIGDRPAFELFIVVDDSYVTDFDGGIATVTVPYTLADDEKAEEVAVYYVAANGELSYMPTTYNATSKKAIFTTTHFSTFAIRNINEDNQNAGKLMFTDIPTDVWYYDDVAFVYENEFMQGISTNIFEPNGTVTRAMMAQIIWNMEGKPTVTSSNSFSDVASNNWYYEAVLWTAENGIYKGLTESIFAPHEHITREQLAVIFYRYAEYKGYDLTSRDDLSKFTDDDKVSDWAIEDVKWAVGSGLMNGKNDGVLDPQGTATRAEISAMIHRFAQKY